MAEPKLTLLVRKNIKEYDERTKETLAKIQEETGLSTDVTFDASFPTFAAMCDKGGYTNRAGEFAYDVLVGLHRNLESSFKDETAKASLQAAWTTGVIRLVPTAKPKTASGYHVTKVDNGDLVIELYELSNVSYIGADLLGKLGDSSGLSLNAALDIKKYEEERAQLLQTIQSDCQLPSDVTLDVDTVVFAAFIDKCGYKDRVGEFIVDILKGLQRNLASSFKDDELARSSLQAAWTTGVVRLVSATKPKTAKGYHITKVDNGDLLVEIYELSNVSYIGQELVGSLGDASGLSLKAALDIKKYEEERSELLQSIQSDCQMPSDVTVDVDIVAFAAFIDKCGYQDRVGEFVVDIIKAVQRNLSSSFKDDELARTALQAAWTTGVIALSSGTKKKGESGYHVTSIVDGNLSVLMYELSNVSYIASDLKGKLGDASGLTLLAALDWKKYTEERDELLQSIHASTQISGDVTLDIDQVAFAAFIDKCGYKDRVGEFVVDILKGLDRNISSSFKDEEMARSALQAAWTTGVVRITSGVKAKGASGYHTTKVVDGDLVVELWELSNVSYIGQELVGSLGDASGLALKSSLDVKKHSEQLAELLEKIKETVGLSADVTIDNDLIAWDAALTKAGYVNRPGEFQFDVVTALSRNLENACKEELSKEAIAEAWTTGVLQFAQVKKLKSGYHSCDFVDGNLVLSYLQDNPCSNVSYIGSDIESKL